MTMREVWGMMANITSDERNSQLLHISMMIVLNPFLHNYMKRFPNKLIYEFNVCFFNLMELVGFI
jgi:hypothetical protein